MTHREESSEARPSIAAYFADPDEAAIPFLTALGHVVVTAAALEGNLRLELTRLLFAAQAGQDASGGKTLGEQAAELETLTAGQLLRRLRERGLPENLEQRIDDAVSRRNRLIHHPFEDPQLVNAAAGNEASDDAVGKLQQLALDCAALSVELHLFAVPKIEASIGASKEELLDLSSPSTPRKFNSRRGGSKLKRSRRCAAPQTGHLTSFGALTHIIGLRSIGWANK